MKLYLVVVVYGVIVSTTGPLQMTMESCMRIAGKVFHQWVLFAPLTPRGMTDGRHIGCIVRNKQPRVGEWLDAL